MAARPIATTIGSMPRPPSGTVAVLLAIVLSACASSPTPRVMTAAPSSAGPSSAPASPATPTPVPSPAASATGAPTKVADLRIELTQVTTGFDRPLSVTNAADGSGRLFVAEQGGRVWIVEDGRKLPSSFLDISDRITTGGERGLLGLAFHPGYPRDPRVFVDYTDRKGDTVVSSFTSGLDADALDPGSEKLIIHVAQPYPNHNGGALVFDPSGALLVGMGDGGSGGDPQDRAEDPAELLGKILRLDVDHPSAGNGYGIPPDNPFVGTEARPEILHQGLRNPWRLSVDTETGDLWIGDVGQGQIEEVDVARAGEKGLDFGWSTLEGTHCYKPKTGCDVQGKTMPVAEYTHADGCVVVGGYVYRGSEHPTLVGTYLYADYCSGKMWALDAASPGKPVLVAETGRSISTFGVDEAGELYVADLGGDGDILQLTPAAG